jgi:hypothetical protein
VRLIIPAWLRKKALGQSGSQTLVRKSFVLHGFALTALRSSPRRAAPKSRHPDKVNYKDLAIAEPRTARLSAAATTSQLNETAYLLPSLSTTAAMNRYARGPSGGNSSRASASTTCQKCLKKDMYTQMPWNFTKLICYTPL